MNEILCSCPRWQVVTFSRRPLEFTTFEEESGQPDQEKRNFQVHANLLEKNEIESSLKEAFLKLKEKRMKPVRRLKRRV